MIRTFQDGGLYGLLMICFFAFAVPASGQDGKTANPDRRPGQIKLDNRWVEIDDESEWDEELVDEGQDDRSIGFSSISLGAGVTGVTKAGQERAPVTSFFAFGGISVRNVGWTLGEKMHLQLGLALNPEYSVFHTKFFRGDLQRYMAGVPIALIDVTEPGESADYFALITPQIGYEKMWGKNRGGNRYEMTQETLYLGLKGQLDLYSFFIKSKVRTSQLDERIATGWLPTISLQCTLRWDVHQNKSSTAKRQGFRDRPSDQRFAEGLGRVVIHRGAWSQGFVDIGVDTRFRFFVHSDGSNSRDDGDNVTAGYIGLFLGIQLSEDIRMYLTGGYQRVFQTHSDSLEATVSIEMLGVFEAIDRWVSE